MNALFQDELVTVTSLTVSSQTSSELTSVYAATPTVEPDTKPVTPTTPITPTEPPYQPGEPKPRPSTPTNPEILPSCEW